MEKKPFLTHVNALRGVAILLVFLYHLIERYCPNGYYGVDVFFVISGYFLFAPMLEKMDAGRFSWIGYYKGKFLRIMPPLAVVVLLVLAALVVVMPAMDLEQNARTAVYALKGTSNTVFARSAVDYFATSSQENPFLNTWYISVLLQILIVAPVLCLLLSKFVSGTGRRLFILLVLAILSALICFQGLLPASVAERLPDFVKDGGSSGSVYYMTLSRVWEVLAGAFIMLLPWTNSKPMRVVCLLVGLGCILVPSFLSESAVALPLVVVAGTMLVIRYGCETPLDRIFQNRGLMWLGSISFSLYLVHWPVMSVWRYVAMRDIQSWEYLWIIAISLIGSIALYRWAERPRWKFTTAACTWAVVFICSITLRHYDGLKGLIHPFADGITEYGSTEYQDWRFDKKLSRDASYPSCLLPCGVHYGGKIADKRYKGSERNAILAVGNDQKPSNFILVGDSYANALFPGMDIIGRKRGWSGLYLNLYLTPIWGRLNTENPDQASRFDREKAEALLAWVAAQDNIKYVFVQQRWATRFGSADTWDGEKITNEEAFDFSAAGLREFCKKLQACGKIVVLVAPVPESRVEGKVRLDSCIKRKAVFSSDPYQGFDWSTNMQDYMAKNGRICRLLRELESEGLCVLLDPVPVLMPQGVYIPQEGHNLTTYDHGHLTVYGATKLVEGLAERIDAILGGGTAPKQEAERPGLDESSTRPSPQAAP